MSAWLMPMLGKHKLCAKFSQWCKLGFFLRNLLVTANIGLSSPTRLRGFLASPGEIEPTDYIYLE